MDTSKTSIVTLLVLIGITALGVWYTTGLDHKRAQQELIDSPANKVLQANDSSTPYKSLDGTTIDLGSYVGQILVVNSWASWAPASAIELPMLADLMRNYSDQDVIVLAINRGESRDTAESFLASIAVLDQVQLIVDADDRYYQDIGGYTMPETIFYDSRGQIVAHERGSLNRVQADGHIQTALERSE